MKLPLIIGEVGLGIAGISALISYEVKATDLKNSTKIEINNKTENLESELRKAWEEKRKLKEEKKRLEEERKLEEIKKKIRRLIKEIQNFFNQYFPKSENKEFLDNLSSFWINSLDNIDNSQFETNLDSKKSELKIPEQKENFKSQYKKMKELSELWRGLSNKITDFQSMLRELHELFKK